MKDFQGFIMAALPAALGVLIAGYVMQNFADISIIKEAREGYRDL